MALNLTNEKKGADYPWENVDGTWETRDARDGGAGPNKWETQSTIVNPESKNNLSITNESRSTVLGLTIDDADWAIDDSEGTIDAHRIPFTNESKT